MIVGAVAISFAEAADSERASWEKAMQCECDRYALDSQRVAAQLRGEDMIAHEGTRRHRSELLVVAGAIAIFVWLGLGAEVPPLAISVPRTITPVVLSFAFCWSVGGSLGKRRASLSSCTRSKNRKRYTR